MLLASYNFLRFGNPFELGIQYMVLVEPNPPKSFSLSYVWTNLSLYFLDPARFSPWFPFFKVSRIPLLPKGYAADPEEMYGMLANLPVLLLAPVGAALAGTWGKFSRPALVAAAATLLFVSVAGVILLYVGANNRYTVDAMCGLPVLTILGIWTVEARVRSGGLRRRLARVLWTALAGYSALFALCAAAERDGIFGYIHPRAYGMLAHAGDFPSFWYDRIRDVTYGPVRLSVRFPADRLGRNEPLVYTGWGPRSNVLFVHYVDPAHIQLGFMGANGTSRGAPLAIDYAKPHSLTVSMGSFYPPRDHPFFDSLPVEDAETLSGTLFVELDGRTVLHQRVYFFDAVARKPELGRGPAALGREWVFTGRMTGG
jgi:hypothetical protein